MTYTDKQLTDSFKLYHERLSAQQKSVYEGLKVPTDISEWSLNAGYPMIKNTFLDLILIFQTLLIQKTNPFVVGSAYHALTNGNDLGVAIRMKADSVEVDPWTTKNDNPKGMRFQSPWYAFEMLKPLLMAKDAEFIWSREYTGFYEIEYKIDLVKYIFFINTTGGLMNAIDDSDVELTYCHASKLSSSFGKTNFGRDSDLLTTDPNITIQRVKSVIGSVAPALSVGVIKIEI